jgi:hypothetical protein
MASLLLALRVTVSVLETATSVAPIRNCLSAYTVREQRLDGW